MRELQREGRLLEPAPWDRCTLFDVAFRPRRMSVEQLEEGFTGLLERLYNPEATARRKRLRAGLMRKALRGREESIDQRVAAMDRIRKTVESKLTLESAKQRDDLFRLQEELGRRERALAEREARAGASTPGSSEEIARARRALEEEFAARLRAVEDRESRLAATEGDSTRIAKEAGERLAGVAAEEARLKEVEARLQRYRDEIQNARQAQPLQTVEDLLQKFHKLKLKEQ